MFKIAALLAAGMVVTAASAVASEDTRELVVMPGPMGEHMLSNMRDHLRALDDVLAALAAGNVRQAGEIAESRMGMTSLDAHGAAHMAPHMPPAMRQTGAALHHAASRLAMAAEDAEVEHSYDSQRKVFAALQDVTAACNACHAAFRLR